MVSDVGNGALRTVGIGLTERVVIHAPVEVALPPKGSLEHALLAEFCAEVLMPAPDPRVELMVGLKNLSRLLLRKDDIHLT